MRSAFTTSRIFNDQDGWYVIMRQSDQHLLENGAKYKQVGNQHLMGPFTSKAKVENWLMGYLAMHGETRSNENYIPDKIDTYH